MDICFFVNFCLEELVDASGKKWAHTVVVKLPFADPDALCASAIKAKCESHLLENELVRSLLSNFTFCVLGTKRSRFWILICHGTNSS